MNKAHLIIVITLGTLFGLASLFFLAGIGPDFGMGEFSDRLDFVQTFWTYLAFWVGVMGITEYLSKIRKSIHPFLLVGGEKEKISITAERFPITIQDLPLHVWNKGRIAIDLQAANLHVRIPKILAPDFAENEHGFKIHDHISNTANRFLGGYVPKVFPGRKTLVCRLNLTVPKPGLYRLEYFFTTDYGFFPKNIKTDSEAEPVQGLGEIDLNVQQDSFGD